MADNEGDGRHEMEIGDYVDLDNDRCGENLLAGDDPVDESHSGSQFRFPLNNSGPIKSVAVNVTVTGRRHYWVGNGRSRSRVKVEFVGDGEPSTFLGGWVYFVSNW